MRRFKKSDNPKTVSNQIMKRKLRASDEWRNLRAEMREENKVDYITQKPLSRSYNLHHMSQSKNIEDYYNLDKNRFRCLNSTTHDVVHWLYRYKDDLDGILERLKRIITDMVIYTNLDSEKEEL